MTDCRASQKELANFYKSQNHILNITSILQGPLYQIGTHTKKISGTFRGRSCGVTICPAVVHSLSYKMNISWFLKNNEMTIHCGTQILKRAAHFIFT